MDRLQRISAYSQNMGMAMDPQMFSGAGLVLPLGFRNRWQIECLDRGALVAELDRRHGGWHQQWSNPFKAALALGLIRSELDTLKWRDDIDNIYVNTGLNDVLDKFWKGSAYTAVHYVGLTDGTPTVVAGDTSASHAGWVEVLAYGDSGETRPVLTLGSVASQSVDNSGSKAVFDINANGTTVGGAFLSTNQVMGGTLGTLIAAGAFTGGDKTLDNGDTLNVTVTLTASSS
jgi:hypothetical protein